MRKGPKAPFLKTYVRYAHPLIPTPSPIPIFHHNPRFWPQCRVLRDLSLTRRVIWSVPLQSYPIYCRAPLRTDNFHSPVSEDGHPFRSVTQLASRNIKWIDWRCACKRNEYRVFRHPKVDVQHWKSPIAQKAWYGCLKRCHWQRDTRHSLSRMGENRLKVRENVSRLEHPSSFYFRPR